MWPMFLRVYKRGPNFAWTILYYPPPKKIVLFSILFVTLC